MDMEHIENDDIRMKKPESINPEKLIRLNVSLKKAFITDFDENKNKKNSRLFNGKSDFITAAIRFYYCHFIDIENETLLIRDSLNSKEMLELLRTIIRKDIDRIILAYNRRYTSCQKMQVSVYITPELRICLSEIETISGKKIGEIIQAAVFFFDEHLSLMFATRRNYIIRVNAMFDELDK